MNYFLVIFIDFFHFFNSNSNLNFGTGCYRWVPLPYPAVAAVTAVYRAVTNGKKNPGETANARAASARTTRPLLPQFCWWYQATANALHVPRASSFSPCRYEK
jgi:hypothetical protein